MTQVKICPNCASTNLSYGDGTMHGGAKDICNDCGFGKYSASLVDFPTIEQNDLEKFKEQFQKHHNSSS